MPRAYWFRLAIIHLLATMACMAGEERARGYNVPSKEEVAAVRQRFLGLSRPLAYRHVIDKLSEDQRRIMSVLSGVIRAGEYQGNPYLFNAANGWPHVDHAQAGGNEKEG